MYGLPQQEKKTRGRPKRYLQDPFLLADWTLDEFKLVLDDVCTGIVRSYDTNEGHYRNALNISKLKQVFCYCPMVSVDGIKHQLDCSHRMAQRYFQAAEHCLPFLIRAANRY